MNLEKQFIVLREPHTSEKSTIVADKLKQFVFMRGGERKPVWKKIHLNSEQFREKMRVVGGLHNLSELDLPTSVFTKHQWQPSSHWRMRKFQFSKLSV